MLGCNGFQFHSVKHTEQFQEDHRPLQKLCLKQNWGQRKGRDSVLVVRLEAATLESQVLLKSHTTAQTRGSRLSYGLTLARTCSLKCER